MKKKVLAMLLSLFTMVGINGINSYCFFIFGQQEEPKTLNKYKKHG